MWVVRQNYPKDSPHSPQNQESRPSDEQNCSDCRRSQHAIWHEPKNGYGKPIAFDEVKYEGNLPNQWSNLSAEEMVLRFWQWLVAGNYVGHGETYLDPHDIIWWAKGGVLHGQSPARLAFLRKIMEEGPADGIEPIYQWQVSGIAGKVGQYYLVYFGREPVREWKFELYKAELNDGLAFQVEVIDTWNMTVTPVEGVFVTKKKDNYVFEDRDHRVVALPGRPYMALRVQRVK